MKIMKIIASVILISASFSAFSEDWDAMGNPINGGTTQPSTYGDMSGDWDSMGNPMRVPSDVR